MEKWKRALGNRCAISAYLSSARAIPNSGSYWNKSFLSTYLWQWAALVTAIVLQWFNGMGENTRVWVRPSEAPGGLPGLAGPVPSRHLFWFTFGPAGLFPFPRVWCLFVPLALSLPWRHLDPCLGRVVLALVLESLVLALELESCQRHIGFGLGCGSLPGAYWFWPWCWIRTRSTLVLALELDSCQGHIGFGLGVGSVPVGTAVWPCLWSRVSRQSVIALVFGLDTLVFGQGFSG